MLQREPGIHCPSVRTRAAARLRCVSCPDGVRLISVIRDEIKALVAQALEAAQAAGTLPAFAAPEVQLEHPARPEHGDYSANLPLRIQGLARMKAVEVAEALRQHVGAHPAVAEVRVAPPGFLNFYLDAAWLASQADAITTAGESYAGSERGSG